jgi:hypothetical protein
VRQLHIRAALAVPSMSFRAAAFATAGGRVLGGFILTVVLALGGRAGADVTFTFVEEGGTVTMTPSGTLDTTKLVVSNLSDGWGGTGTEENGPGDIDIMGGTDIGAGITAQFGFHAGTDASAITNPGGPFAFDHFPGISVSGTKAFATYSGISFDGSRQPGIGMSSGDIIGGLWTPNQAWTYPPSSTFASAGLIPGTYTVSDSETGESITIAIVPEPATLGLLAMAAPAILRRRRRAGATLS